ncbi:MAG: hypothetical protein KGZ82_10605 [Bacteroidales bacterium]|nr:hypothetical protein [Bacteroidales bacterium]
MSLSTFLDLTPGQFFEALRAFREQREAQVRRDEELAWQVARWQVWRTLAPPAAKKISVFDLIELPGDDAIKRLKLDNAKPSTRERFEQLKRKWQNG